jgi:GlpG protein
MRQIGNVISNEQASGLQGYLESMGIATHLDADGDGTRVWVKDEDRLEEARQILTQFLANPAAPEFKTAPNRPRRDVESKTPRPSSSRTVDVRRDVWNQGMARRTPVVTVLLAVSVLVAIISNLGTDRLGMAMQSLSFFNPVHVTSPEWSDRMGPWTDIRHGQVWRLLTPIFIHFGIVHVVFNMWMLVSLGTPIESKQGSRRLAILVIAAAVLGNVGQIVLQTSVGGYGGMSGVVYGLAGFMWFREIHSPGDGPPLPRESLIMLVIWLILGFAGVLDQPESNTRMANWAHLFGFLGGVLCAISFPARRSRFQAQI